MKIINFTLNKIYKTGLLATMLLSSTLLNAQTWNLKTNLVGFNSARQGHIAFVADNKIYVGGGNEGAQKASSIDLNTYNPVANKWDVRKNLPGAANRTFSISFTINGKTYMGLGAENYFMPSISVLKDFWEYDVATDTWTQKGDFPGGPNYGGKVFVADGKAYLIGGQSGESTATSGTADMWEYEPSTDKWTKKAPYPGVSAIVNPFVFTIGNKGYISAGKVLLPGESSTSFTANTYEYDPAKDKWTKKADYPNALADGVAFEMDGKAYCGLGSTSPVTAYSDFNIYDPIADSWTALSNSFPGTARYNSFVVTIGNKAYIGGGASPGLGVPYHTEVYELSVPLSVRNTVSNNVNIACYPNPTTGKINISGLNNTETSTIHVYNLLGKEVFSQKGNSSSATINIGSVPAGQYILTVTENTGVVYRKAISLL